VPKANHGQLREEALRAMRSGQADPSVYEPWLILRNESPASSNKGVLADITGALADPRRLRDPVLGWAEWWVGQPLHEREALTPSGSYRPDMDIGAWVLAGIALDAGATVLASRLLDRSRAGLSYLLLGAGLAPTRAITDHGIPGTAMIVIGNGKLLPLPGSGGRAPRIIQAGKRGHVRADLRDVGERVEGGSSFAGAWMYESGWSLSAMVAQALGMPYDGKPVSWEHGMFVECRRRWPSLPPYGYGSAERSDGRDLLANLADPDAARRIVKLAAEALPALPFEFVRYSDRSIVVVANELDESSTGGVAIAAQWSNGNWLHASCDTGGRAKDDIRAQRVVEVGGAFECFHVDRPDKRLRVVKPRGVAEQRRRSPAARRHPGDRAAGPAAGVAAAAEAADAPGAPALGRGVPHRARGRGELDRLVVVADRTPARHPRRADDGRAEALGDRAVSCARMEPTGEIAAIRSGIVALCSGATEAVSRERCVACWLAGPWVVDACGWHRRRREEARR